MPGTDVFLLDMVFPLAKEATDARGIAVLRVPGDAMTQWIFAGKPGVGFDYFENYRSLPAIPWNPPLPSAGSCSTGARTVRVRAVDSAGRPVPGVELTPGRSAKKGKLKAVNFSGPLMLTLSPTRRASRRSTGSPPTSSPGRRSCWPAHRIPCRIRSSWTPSSPNPC